MRHWILFTLGWIAFSIVLKIIAIGFADYPRMTSRGLDTVDLLFGVGWLIWGVCVML